MIRVLVVDDHEIVRTGLRQLICGEPDMTVCGEAGSVAEMWEMTHPGCCDVLILDISLPDRSGLEALRDIKAAYPGLPVLILSIHTGGQYASRALKRGAAGYVNKASAAETVVEAIRRAASGGGEANGGGSREVEG